MAKILFNYLDYNHNKVREKENTYGGVGYYRLIKVAEMIKAQTNHEVEVMGKEAVHFGDSITNWDKVFQKYDVLWLASVYGEQNMAAIFYWAQHHKKKVVMDVDDNYLDLPDTNDMHSKFAPGKKERALFSASISLADVVTVSTEPLRDRLQEHFRKVYKLDKKFVVIPNMNDLKDWDFEPIAKDPKKITIGYPGSTSHQDDLIMIMPTLAKLMKKYEHLHLEIMGCISKNKIQTYFGRAGFDDDSLMRIGLVRSTDTFKEYPEHLSKQKWDIGIAPLVDSAFTRCKSHIKWMEYSMFNIPVVASRVYPYFMELDGRPTIEHGETGYLVKPNEWEEYLTKLIEDEALRKRIGAQARDAVIENWQYSSKKFDKIVSDVVGE